MGYYKYNFEELNNLSMLDVVEELNHKVKTSGRSKVMLCPFHEDHHPSMTIYDHAVKCFACGKHFGVIDFVKEAENMDLKEACNWLAERFNVGRTWVETSNRPATKAPSKKRQNIIDLQKIIDKSICSLPRQAFPPSTGRAGVGPSFVFDLDYVAEHMDRVDPHPHPLPHDWEGSAIRNTSSQTYCISHPSPNYGANEVSEERLNVSLCRSEGRTSICSTEGKEGMGVRGSSSFSKCLSFLFDSETVSYVTDMYGIGCWAVDDTMFPIIDKDLRVHNIKIQHYDTNPLSDRFFHKDGNTWWYGNKYLETHKDAKGTHNVNCYFGEHLISRFPSVPIILVESPKNAVLGACEWPEYVWVAAGNKGMLNRDRLECMRGRKVIVMPDCDAVEEWREKLSTMQDIATFVISEMVEEFRKIGPKADVGDWIIAKHFVPCEVKSE